MSDYSKIETKVSDRILLTSMANNVSYPTHLCIQPEEGRKKNPPEIKKMKDGQLIFLRQVSIPTIAKFLGVDIPSILKSTALQALGSHVKLEDGIDFPKEKNLTVDFASVHKTNGKYVFRVLEANGITVHSAEYGDAQHLLNDAVKNEVLKVLGVEKKHVSDGVTECSDGNKHIDDYIKWLMDI